jgi:hypothetical protein
MCLKRDHHVARDRTAVYPKKECAQQGKEESRPLPEGNVCIDHLHQRKDESRQSAPRGRSQRFTEGSGYQNLGALHAAEVVTAAAVTRKSERLQPIQMMRASWQYSHGRLKLNFHTAESIHCRNQPEHVDDSIVAHRHVKVIADGLHGCTRT